MAIAEIIFSGFVSKAINDVVDTSKDKIRKAVENKNHQDFLTKLPCPHTWRHHK